MLLEHLSHLAPDLIQAFFSRDDDIPFWMTLRLLQEPFADALHEGKCFRFKAIVHDRFFFCLLCAFESQFGSDIQYQR
jgi:hypothetical protein